MTTQELARCVGMANQTINRWIREQHWVIEPIPGVKGGRARLIHITPEVQQFLSSTPKLRHISLSLQAAESASAYSGNNDDPVWRQIQDMLQMMTSEEQRRLHMLLAREGLRGFLEKLDIAEVNA